MDRRQHGVRNFSTRRLLGAKVGRRAVLRHQRRASLAMRWAIVVWCQEV